MNTLFLVIAIVMALVYIAVELTQKPLISLFVKALASLSFIMLGLSSLLLGYNVFPQVVGGDAWFSIGYDW